MWVAQSTIVTLWFDSSELAFAFGVNTCFARLGTVMNDKLSPIIANAYNASVALWTGAAFCFVSLVNTTVLVYIDWHAEHPHPHHPLDQALPPTQAQHEKDVYHENVEANQERTITTTTQMRDIWCFGYDLSIECSFFCIVSVSRIENDDSAIYVCVNIYIYAMFSALVMIIYIYMPCFESW
jgi:hypothetical protein